MPFEDRPDPTAMRVALWRQAARKEISVEELYAKLDVLIETYGEACYNAPRLGRR